MLLGDTGVGKSSLMFRFTEGEFKSSLIGTAGVDYKMKNIEFGGKSVKIQIWDTAGQERYRTLTKAYYRGAAGVILVYDVTDPVSFENLEYWLKKIKKHGDENVEILLLGNKIDLINERVVTSEQSEQLAESKGVSCYETSAKDSINVDKAFKQLLNRIISNEYLKDKITMQASGGNINGLGSIRLEATSRDSIGKKQDNNCC